METRTVRMNRHYKCSTLNSKLHGYDIHGRHLQILAVDIPLKFDAALVLKIKGNVTFSVKVKLNEDFDVLWVGRRKYLQIFEVADVEYVGGGSVCEGGKGKRHNGR